MPKHPAAGIGMRLQATGVRLFPNVLKLRHSQAEVETLKPLGGLGFGRSWHAQHSVTQAQGDPKPVGFQGRERDVSRSRALGQMRRRRRFWAPKTHLAIRQYYCQCVTYHNKGCQAGVEGVNGSLRTSCSTCAGRNDGIGMRWITS